mmetsp:Transcript_83945/g.251606  ORF Transcript_83945/g.251606 Transcript_83945/m.251606 type:complete len:244 (-) Transcript_83945:1070-1801(-)
MGVSWLPPPGYPPGALECSVTPLTLSGGIPLGGTFLPRARPSATSAAADPSASSMAHLISASSSNSRTTLTIEPSSAFRAEMRPSSSCASSCNRSVRVCNCRTDPVASIACADEEETASCSRLVCASLLTTAACNCSCACMMPIASARSNLPCSMLAHSSRDIFSSSFCLRPSTSRPLLRSAALVADVSRRSATVPAASACLSLRVFTASESAMNASLAAHAFTSSARAATASAEAHASTASS